MAELTAPASRVVTPPFTLDIRQILRAAQRVFTLLVILHLIWSIGVTTGVLGRLSAHFTSDDPTAFLVNLWLIQQNALRALVLIMVVGTLLSITLLRGEAGNYGTRALTSLFGTLVIWLIAERVFFVTSTSHYILLFWGLQVANGLALGSLYALIALGYTLVYGILLMINFAHGDVMMVGSYIGYFALQLFRGDANVFGESPSFIATFLVMIVITLIAMTGTTLTGLAVERVAYRPLRRAPRLAPLISAIGMSIFLEQAAQRIFGPGQKGFERPTLLSGTFRLDLGKDFGPGVIPIQIMGIVIVVSALVLMAGLYFLVQRSKLGRAMRAVAEDKDTAALMGTNVNQIIAFTFALGAALAGAAGVLWGFYTKQTDPFAGFTPGLKAFTAAVLGGIGNIPGAVFGGVFLGLAEALGPSALGIPNEYQNVIAFSLLVFILIFRPTGLLGEILAEKKV